MNIFIRIISSATERYVRNVGEDVTSIQNSLQSLDVRSQQNHQELRAWHVSVEQQKQGNIPFKAIGSG